MKHLHLLYTLLFDVAVLLFFGLAYPHHLHYQEQYQLFLFDWDYVWDIVKLPGGVADLFGRFCTQFFLFAWVGALIIALLLSLVQLLTLRLANYGWLYGLSFVPSFLLWLFLLDENALFGAVWAVLLTQLAFCGLLRLPNGWGRRILSIVAFLILYWVAFGGNHYYRIPNTFPTLFYAAWFSAMIIPLVLFARSLRITEPYDNPAQRRKLLAKNRRQRRWSAAILVCMAIAVVNLTAVKAYDNRVVELSPPEEYTVEGDKILIPLENLEDGHLHRYEYTTKDKVDVRWIVIKKPGASSYGVGLDACNVCGIAGYFERSGQVVCKRCDVVMNINTIGFKGGCNPIPLAYKVDGGNMIIELSDVLDGEVEFK